MIYNIDYKGECVFDIEFFMTHSEGGLWYSEISSLPIPKGMITMARDINEENLTDFIEDCGIIAELRGELYEGGKLWNGLISGNKPAESGEAHERHNKLQKALDSRLREFCSKWGCSLNID